jgi:hypothetical protein
LVLSGIFFLRNKLAEKEEERVEHQEEISVNTSKGKRSVMRGKHLSKMSILNRIEEKVVFQGWIGAG